MEIDVQGGVQVAERMPESVRIFVLPPDMRSLRARLEGRKTEAEEQLKRRLAQQDLSEEERRAIIEEIQKLESAMLMGR